MMCCASPAVLEVERSDYSPSLQTDPRFAERAKLLAKTFSTLTPAKVVGRDEPLLVNLDCIEDEENREDEFPQTELSAGPTPRLHSKFVRVSSSKQLKASDLKWSDSRKVLQNRINDEMRSSTLDLRHESELTAETRLTDRLERLGLDMHVVSGDGNCQFRSVSNELYGSQDHHYYIRKKACQYIRDNREYFEGFLGEDFDVYVQQMARLRTWGDELTLRAICDLYGILVNVVTSDQINWYLKYEPKFLKYDKELFLTYIAPVHYNAIRRRGAIENLTASFTSRISRSLAGSLTRRSSVNGTVSRAATPSPQQEPSAQSMSLAHLNTEALLSVNSVEGADLQQNGSGVALPRPVITTPSRGNRASYVHFPRLAHVQAVRGSEHSSTTTHRSSNPPVAPVSPGSNNSKAGPIKTSIAKPKHHRVSGSTSGASVQFAEHHKGPRSVATTVVSSVAGINSLASSRPKSTPITLEAPNTQHHPVRSRR